MLSSQSARPFHISALLILIMQESISKVIHVSGVGSSMVKRLGALGVNSVSELRSVAMSTLEEEFGHKTAQMMRDLSVGIDESKVTATGRPQTMSDEDSFKKCDSLEDARKRMKELLDSLFKRCVQV